MTFFMKSEAFTECFMWWYCYSRFSWLWIFRSTRSTTYRSSLRLRIWKRSSGSACSSSPISYWSFSCQKIKFIICKPISSSCWFRSLILILSITTISPSRRSDLFPTFHPARTQRWALAIVVGWLTSNRASGLFVSYLTMLLAMVYFSSLIFFVIEQKVNPEVKDYNDALWWAFMDVTTVGSNIIAITPTGRILSVLLAALGMMMFPIFTVYVTSLVQSANKKKENYYNQTHPVSSGQASEAKPAGSTQTDK